MRGSRVTEAAQRQSPRGTPSPRTSSVDSEPLHSRARLEKSPKVTEGVSSHGPQTNRKKIGTRIADLESQLGLAQEELKSLKDQLQKKPKKQEKLHNQVEDEVEENKKESSTTDEEVSAAAADDNTAPVSNKHPSSNELDLKNEDTCTLKTKLEDKERETELLRLENEGLRSQLDEKSTKISSALSEINELNSKLNEALQELAKSKSNESQLLEKLEAMERSREETGTEMERLRVQTEQWRKAADAAAAVLSSGSRRVTGRCGSMDAHHMNSLGFPGLSSIIDDSEGGLGNERRKGTGIRILGELWKRKGEK